MSVRSRLTSGDLLARGNLHVPPLQQRIEFRLAFRTFAESLEQRWVLLRVPNILIAQLSRHPPRLPGLKAAYWPL
jgi:hypothetical protein